MSTPILATKLYIPPLRPNVVHRPRLIERLQAGAACKLTLLSAPAGFGKSTLLSEWITGLHDGESGHAVRRAAWLSLDQGDNDLKVFLTYLVAALRTITPALGQEVLDLLQSPPPLPTEPILTVLLNEIAAAPAPFTLVLDDYHLIDATAVVDALAFLIERLPPQMHLVIATREDPSLPLARYRAQGELTELRAADLRFTMEEAASFLNQMMGLPLSKEDIATLENRTEGWIAGLQLAALALQRTVASRTTQDSEPPEMAGLIRSFTGSHRFVLDYLVEEVLQQQPESYQAFLLHTSILDRLCGPLCDAILQGEPGRPIPAALSGQDTLEYLERANLLIVPLDDKRQWYRYHHLFADVLQMQLQKQMPDRVPALHRRACEWYAQNDAPSDAIHHALAAAEFEQAADLIELAWSEIRRSCFQSPTWLSWAKALPAEIVRLRPVLSVGYAWELLNFGELEDAATWMQHAERWLEPTPEPAGPAQKARPRPAGMVVANEDEFAALRASLATARGQYALGMGDIPATMAHARRALALMAETDDYPRGIASALLGLACWIEGDLETACQTIIDAMASLQKAGNALFAISTTFVLADIRFAQGRLRAAMQAYEHALQIATTQGDAILQGTADLYLGLSELYHEQGDATRAGEHLRQSETLGAQVALPHWPRRLCLVRARILHSQGDLAGALAQLQAAEQFPAPTPMPDVRPLGALRARVWLALGKLDEAMAWTRAQGLSIDDELSYGREFAHITLARVLVAQHRSGADNAGLTEATALLDRLLPAAEAGGRTGSVIEILLLQALVHQARGARAAAHLPLLRALALAEPEGYVRIFVDEGEVMAELLQAVAPDDATGYASRLIATLATAAERTPVAPATRRRPAPDVEPLSEREAEVLRLLCTDLTGPEIARKLVISLNTLRTHTKNIYSKLGVNSRRAAVRRAEELALV